MVKAHRSVKRQPADTDGLFRGFSAADPIAFGLVTCPALLFPFARAPFDPPKALAAWTIAAAAFGAALATGEWAAAWRGSRSRTFVAAAFALVAVFAATAALGGAPALAWLGSSVRRFGAATQIGLLLVAVATIAAANDFPSIEYLTGAAVIGSAGPVVYSLAQALAVDPLNPAGASVRAGSTFGNPVFLAAYLVVVWPLTAAWLLREWRRPRRQRRQVAALAVLILCQTAALLLLGAKGPLLALTASTAFTGAFAVSATTTSPAKRAVALAIVAAMLAGTSVAGWRALQWSTTSNTGAERSAQTVAVRLMLWRSAWTEIRARHALLFGSGPESVTALLSASAAPELRRLEGHETVPDRIHNEILETVATIGLTGLALRVVMLACAMLGAWRALRVAGSAGVRAPAVALSLAAMAAWLAHMLEIQVSVDTPAAALVGAVALALCVRGLESGAPDHDRAPDDRLAALGGWAAAVLLIGLAGPAARGGVQVVALAGGAWLLGVFVAGGTSAQIGIGAATWIVPSIVWLSWHDVPPASADRAGLFVSLAAVCAAFLAWRSVRRIHPERNLGAAAAAALCAAVVAWPATMLAESSALARAADLCLQRRDLSCAAALYRSAAGQDAANDEAWSQAGSALMGRAEAAVTAADRDAMFAGAREDLLRARGANPFDYHHPRNLAALERRWTLTLAPAARPAHGDAAAGWFDAAVRLAPTSGGLLAEWANLDLELGHVDDALTKLERAIVLGDVAHALIVADAWLRASGGATAAPATFQRASADFQSRGYPMLAAEYARRASQSQRR